jgi:hypothetical protein
MRPNYFHTSDSAPSPSSFVTVPPLSMRGDETGFGQPSRLFACRLRADAAAKASSPVGTARPLINWSSMAGQAGSASSSARL